MTIQDPRCSFSSAKVEEIKVRSEKPVFNDVDMNVGPCSFILHMLKLFKVKNSINFPPRRSSRIISSLKLSTVKITSDDIRTSIKFVVVELINGTVDVVVEREVNAAQI
ncbi:hypothetical protein AVEN_191081-1 [Araneus ventricosus]|uniref:Uncharacterized protein n=1 Tax=Araneus ventricosus TaxID=182803 RepID=A0A4Y2AXP1_ARAVE|nr:hypothetical protein AVEN_191081-1 [Araneus ventricosus]